MRKVARDKPLGKSGGKQPDTALSERFLLTVLLQEPYRSQAPRQGVRIVGADFQTPVNLSYARLTNDLWLLGARFHGGLDLSHVRTSSSISLEGSTFAGLSANAAVVGDELRLDEIEVASTLGLRQVEVGRRLSLHGARLRGEPEGLDLAGAKIGDSVDLDQLTSGAGNINLDAAVVGGALTLRTSAVRSVWMVNGQVRGAVDLSDMRLPPLDPKDPVVTGGHAVPGELKLNNLEAGKDLSILSSRLSFITLRNARIGGNLAIEGPKGEPSPLRAVDLSGTSVGHKLSFGSDWYGPINWSKDASLALRNTSVQAIQDGVKDCSEPGAAGKSPWPRHLTLGGFTLQQLVTLDGEVQVDMSSCSSAWWIDWLGRQDPYLPEPYLALASVLARVGQKATANEILYAGKERELAAAHGGDRFLLLLQKAFIGYGYRLFRSFYWLVLFVVLGAVVLRLSKQGKPAGMPYGIAYSFDMLVPLLRLRDAHQKLELRGIARYYFYLHKVIGYVLASFLIAGVSGLTK